MASPASASSVVDPAAVLKASRAVLGAYVGEKTAREWTIDMLRRLQIGIGEDRHRQRSPRRTRKEHGQSGRGRPAAC